MSFSPPIRRLSTASSNSNTLSHKQSEDLINAYEAEEERIINILSRKLEQLREEKIDLENALEAESESHVNRLSRELSLLRQQQSDTSPDGATNAFYLNEPSTQFMLETMRRDNEQLRAKLADMEQDYGKVKRMNEVYREELIEHRKTLGLSVDNLIGLNSSDQLNHRRSASFSSSQFSSNASSPSTSLAPLRSNGIAIPRRTAIQSIPTPLSHSPDSPFSYPLFSPPQTLAGSQTTQMTSPPSSSVESAAAVTIPRGLTYPSVPPPSLASSFGSPSVMYHHIPLDDRSDITGRRNSNSGTRPTGAGTRVSRRGSVERGGRVAESGTLVPRSRAGSQSTAQALAITEEVQGD